MCSTTITNMLMLCCSSEFGPTGLNTLTLVVLRSPHFAVGSAPEKTQMEKPMLVRRHIFVSLLFIEYLG
jgi:hypothetical protein